MIKKGGADIDLLKRRFRAFAGVNNAGKVIISNNFNRLGLLNDTFRSRRFDQIVQQENDRMTSLAAERSTYKDRWQQAIQSNGVLVEEAKIPFPRKERSYPELKQLYFGRTIRNMLAALGMAIFGYLEFVTEVLRPLVRLRSIPNPDELVYLFFGGGLLFFGRRAYKTLRAFLLYRDIAKDIESIGEALVQTLHQFGHIKTQLLELNVVTKLDSDGVVTCHLEGGTTYEKSSFLKCLIEILEVVDNPRYIIIRKSRLFKLIPQRDYHSVPEILSGKQELAQAFASNWNNRVGRCELVYAYSTEGRLILLKSRIRSLAREFDTEPMRESKWQ
ncbi:hypothetical protein [Phaeocystidibacter luteus]|uniref:Uncharacterized protein n=1 Tax=Phaeocystidibacter luteus TaxID=911197 RepID=A0A6N6RFN7_9FLAO|nr:hypothetical protein [Phaeocystidibacter luteus]KAB2809971.1 hypothetical protein F8C67_08815 [Phaeocystidibacter luteus]